MPDSNLQPALILNQAVQFTGIFPSRDFGSPHASIGYIRTFASNQELQPAQAEGGLIPISFNTALFSILGTFYGGNGISSFGLPNLTGQIVVGAGGSYSVGQDVGNGVITIANSNMPTTAGGSGQPFQNMQSGLAMNWIINVEGLYPVSGGDITLDSIGVLSQFAGNFAPNGTMFAHGQLLNIGDYSSLFAIIGTTYGGDGINTFALPDLRGRTAIGAGNGFTVGQVVGSEQTYLTNANLPTQVGGGGVPVSNYGPSLVLNPVIITQGLYPSSDRDFDSEENTMSEIIFFAGNYTTFRNALPAIGQVLPIASNQALFSLLGTSFGGNGTTNFALPNLIGRAVVGEGNGWTVGNYIGTPTFVIDYTDLPPVNLTANGSAPNLQGTPNPDTLNGDSANNILVGREGNDVLNGGAGNDRLNGGSGADIMRGGIGDDIYVIPDASDTIVELFNEGNDTVIADISYTLGDNLENLQLNGAGAVNGTGNALNNVITGSSANNLLEGGGGDDTITGQTGNDTLAGGEGNDSLDGGNDDDVLHGDAGDDVLLGNNGHDVANGGAGNDSLNGGFGNDTLNGGDDNDTLVSGAGNDILNGDEGDDILNGEAGNDTLNGGNGDDIVQGGAGRDIVTGGSGADIFRFVSGDFSGVTSTTADRIKGFNRAQGDIIDLSGVTAFTFIGTGTFTGVAGQLRYQISGGNTLVTGDIDGDGVADFMIRLDGAIALLISDFGL